MDSRLSSFFHIGVIPVQEHDAIMKIPRASSLSPALPAISEDGQSVAPSGSAHSAPAIPPRSSRRNSNRNFTVVGPPTLNYQDNPPSYWEDDNSLDGKDTEKISQWRERVVNNKIVAKRGGWRRLCLIAVVLILCIVGLVVGLVVGLRNRGHGSYVTSISLQHTTLT